jgi:hypothetical protein
VGRGVRRGFPQGFDDDLPRELPFFDSVWSELRVREPLGEDDEDDDGEDFLREARRGAHVAAVARRGDGFVTFRSAVVARNGVPWFALSMPVEAAAYDRTGERLAVFVAAAALSPPMLVVFDLRGEAPVIVFHKTLRG